MNVKIKDIPLLERPRERLIKGDVSELSNEDLLALILATGTREYSVKGLANMVLKEVGDIKKLKDINLLQLTGIKGIGQAKACSLLASIELGKRINTEVDNINNLKFNNSELVFKYFKDKIGSKLQEYFYCLYLDNKKKIIKEKLLFIGTLNHSLVHPREVFKEAYLLSASSLICIHNHPSGNVIPSREDITITEKLSEIGRLLGINVVDHIIVSKNNYYSFFENNQI
ncbi:MAG: DNA repair protein RadC [Bacilli bacterium]